MKMKLTMIFVVVCLVAAFQPAWAQEEQSKDEAYKIVDKMEIPILFN